MPFSFTFVLRLLQYFYLTTRMGFFFKKFLKKIHLKKKKNSLIKFQNFVNVSAKKIKIRLRLTDF